ncbi:hypothetical protein ACSQ6I_20705 [Anabaena sp. WFMT]|uniref:hypothetical protein n=1 Tax=Anabaena sp. WFMT TaxID=3449730 RepID=UPI003F21C6D4
MNTLFRELSPDEIETVSGGIMGAGLEMINTNTADVQNAGSIVDTNAQAFTIHENKVGTVDMSRSVYIWSL